MNGDGYKEVYFDKYCKSCEHEDLKDCKDPCHDCLSTPINLYSHKPIHWEEKNKK